MYILLNFYKKSDTIFFLYINIHILPRQNKYIKDINNTLYFLQTNVLIYFCIYVYCCVRSDEQGGLSLLEELYRDCLHIVVRPTTDQGVRVYSVPYRIQI